MTTPPPIGTRKDEHLDICLKQDVNSLNHSYWNEITLNHCALPEINLSDIELDTQFLGLKLKAPILISSITGGTPEGEKINSILADFAQNNSIAMGVGSQRIALEKPLENFFNLRAQAPNGIFFANLGAVQFNYGVSIDQALNLADKLQAQAFILHLNPLQEAIQSGGDTNFKGLLSKIENFKRQLSIPLIVKEVGCGIDTNSAKDLKNAGVDAIDVAGKGGTHWGYIEGLREESQKSLGDIYRDWGIPTPTAIRENRKALGPTFPIIGSGGIRNGLDAAKAIFIGADIVGMALPFLKEAHKGPEALQNFYDEFCKALKIALLCSGKKTCRELKNEQK
jgi:isopentenyl-diphosphate delta-isomerase